MNTGNAGDVPSPLASQNGLKSNYLGISTLVPTAARESNLLLAPHQIVARKGLLSIWLTLWFVVFMRLEGPFLLFHIQLG